MLSADSSNNVCLIHGMAAVTNNMHHYLPYGLNQQISN